MQRAGLVVVNLTLLFLALIAGGMFYCSYNRMVTLQENVNTAFADLQVQYQRRADLIPNLVEIVKGYAKHEREVLTAVTEARAKAGQIRIGGNVTPQQIQQFIQSQNQLSAALSRLMLVVERYPELKADQRFAELQAQLECTENRIAFARNRYNEAVRQYNIYIRRFPGNIFASMFGFEPYPYFQAEASAQQAPRIKF